MNHVAKLALTMSALFSTFTLNASPYVSAQIGRYGIDIYDHHNGVAGRLAAGYLWHTTERLHLGLETGLNLFQNLNYTCQYFYDSPRERKYKSTYLDALFVIDYFVTQRFDLVAKFGAAYVWQDSPFINPIYNNVKNDYEGFTAKVALGFGYNLTNKVNLNLMIDIPHSAQKVNYVINQLIPSSSFMLGLRYQFC
ncbi:outer membrane protein [Candidatus Berkiella aquae]|uniref:Porin family protein n=1 Tax=Candidatus Berkiella aquae TaxID=295108 RepID=A0A0Q9YXR9_9GAMM|nr:outer membrane beta-barrel protein [Candidatus Berkiella aquae]MCS5710528.1 porin family protein [Candidatus Berkiella aquae]